MLSSYWTSFLHWVQSAGYPGMGVAMLLEGLGVPFPGDAVMAFYGYMIAGGHFSYLQAVIWCTSGCWLGSLAAFFIGRNYGTYFLLQYGRYLLLKPKHIRFTEQLSERYGVWVLIVGRFLPGVRTLSSYFAGIGGMTWSTFILMSLLGFVMWCSVWIGLGFWLGEYAEALIARLNTALLVLALTAAAGTVGWFGFRRR
jgi:membrane protein DedA with SNARE-associated domain